MMTIPFFSWKFKKISMISVHEMNRHLRCSLDMTLYFFFSQKLKQICKQSILFGSISFGLYNKLDILYRERFHLDHFEYLV